MKTERSEELFARAKAVLPGGVNSPVRAFGSVGLTPRFIAKAEGSHMTDADGNEYLDYVCSWGPMLLGHDNDMVREAVLRACRDGLSFGAATGREVEIAELICRMAPDVEMLRMVNSGTEGVMSALRLARGATGRDKIVKFVGCYHGHSDAMLVKAGSGLLTTNSPSSAGVTRGAAQDTLLADYNSLPSVERLFDENPGKIAAVIVEPVAANMGVVPPQPGFLEGLRALCTKNGALLIFDEVITGFRLAPGGAAEYYHIHPDITVFGKIIGGGMPVGAYGASRDLMQNVSPLGPVYQAGTLSGNPVAMAAGLAMLRQLEGNYKIYQETEKKAKTLADGLRRALPGCTVNQVGSLLSPFFTKKPVVSYDGAASSDTKEFARYFRHMLSRGIYLAPSQFEAMFVSAAHTDEEIARTVAVAEEFSAQ